MNLRFIHLALTAILLTSFDASAQTMNIHSQGQVQSFELSEIDSITFTVEQVLEPGDSLFQLTEEVGIIMRWIPPGEFQMGSPEDEQDRGEREGPLHLVMIERGFWMGKYEVTQAQWVAVMGYNPSADFGVGDNYPVYDVCWDEIQEFEERVGEDFRLPTEAEWEYACRAGSETRFYWGNDQNYGEIERYAWYNENSGGTSHPVGEKLANPWGLHDMSGNVWEWCEDWYHDNYDGAPNDGSPWLVDGGETKIVRGGTWQVEALASRSAYRDQGFPDDNQRYYDRGFRLVKTVD